MIPKNIALKIQDNSVEYKNDLRKIKVSVLLATLGKYKATKFVVESVSKQVGNLDEILILIKALNTTNTLYSVHMFSFDLCGIGVINLSLYK